jgi:hypothetical protein
VELTAESGLKGVFDLCGGEIGIVSRIESDIGSGFAGGLYSKRSVEIGLDLIGFLTVIVGIRISNDVLRGCDGWGLGVSENR